MKRFLIERDTPNVGSLGREQLKGLAATGTRQAYRKGAVGFGSTRGWRVFR